MEIVGFIVFLIVIGVLLDMARGKKPEFKLYHKQQLEPWDQPPISRPSRYRIDGIDKQTSMDTTWYCHANSPENAKIKAELQGIIVSNVHEDR